MYNYNNIAFTLAYTQGQLGYRSPDGPVLACRYYMHVLVYLKHLPNRAKPIVSCMQARLAWFFRSYRFSVRKVFHGRHKSAFIAKPSSAETVPNKPSFFNISSLSSFSRLLTSFCNCSIASPLLI